MNGQFAVAIGGPPPLSNIKVVNYVYIETLGVLSFTHTRVAHACMVLIERAF